MNIRTRLLLPVLFAVLVPAIFVGVRVVQDRNADIAVATRFAAGDLTARIASPFPRGAIGVLMAELNNAANSIQSHRDQIGDLDGLLCRSLGEHIECRLALGPDVWLAIIDRTHAVTDSGTGGHINIYSEDGHGTTVKLYLPRSDDGT